MSSQLQPPSMSLALVYVVCVLWFPLFVPPAVAFAPFSVNDPGHPFVNVTHPTPPTSRYFASSVMNRPVPTNAWWMNAVLYNNVNPIMPLPLQVIMEAETVAVGSTHKQDFPDFASTWWVDGMKFGSLSPLAHYQVTDFDRLSVTMSYQAASAQGSMTLPITRGSPYMTAIYDNIAPRISTIEAIVAVNKVTSSNGVISGTKLKCTLNNGQVWIIYTNHNATWTWSPNAIYTTSTVPGTAGSFVVRLAHLHNDFQHANGNPDTILQEMENVLDTYSSAYATGGTVDYIVDYSTSTINTTIQWKVQGSGQLIIMSLPHQQAMMSNQIEYGSPLRFDSIKGTMLPVVGQTWRMSIAALASSFTAPRPIAPRLAQPVHDALFADSQTATIVPNIDPYTFGKTSSKLARLILIADETEQSALASRLRKELSSALVSWLTGNTSDYLCYDKSWGGIVSINGLNDSAADFGNGYYNDHHFHYGYFAYAVATLVKSPEYSSFATKYRSAIYAIVRDYANPSDADPYFPVMRHVDAFDGHSWASGIVGDFGDNRNQESSSEAINSYYGLMLLGKALGNANMEATGLTLYTLEVHAVNLYWHMTSTKSIYPPIFSLNKCASMIWSSKAVIGTWFASGSLYTHGINMMPYTPASEYYMTLDWVVEEYPYLLRTYNSSMPPPTEPWMGIMYGSEAVIDPVSAQAHLTKLTEWDNGNSLTNMLYWVATRPTMPDLTGYPGSGAQPGYGQ
jgi:endo-1,3(4)-beta-glucanase